MITMSHSSHMVEDIFEQWISPVIFVFGTLGNVLIMVIIGRTFKDTDTNLFVWIVALADLMVLMLSLLPRWLKATDIWDLFELDPWLCKILKFSSYMSMDFAIWVVVCFTLERFVAICFPFKKKILCQVGQVQVYCSVLFCMAVVKNISVFWTRGKEYVEINSTYVLISNCGITSEENEKFVKLIRPWIVLVVSNIIPLVIFLFCNSMVIWTLRKRKSRSWSLKSTDGDHRNNDIYNQNIVKNLDRIYFQVTMMCQAVSLAFIICVIPSVVLLIGEPYWGTSQNYSIAKSINNQLVYVNHSINLYVYLAIGGRFRTETVRILSCNHGFHRESVSMVTSSTHIVEQLNDCDGTFRQITQC